MAVEIEAKMQIDHPETVIVALKARGALPLGEYLELNTFFDTEDRELLAADQGLRLRVSTDLKTRQQLCVLTHKGPDRYGPLKNREETELVVADADNAARLLERLGFFRTLSFEKRRQSWSFEACRIEMDQVPLLGTFVEIEGPSEIRIMKVRELLGMTERPLIKASYIAMLTAYLQERGESRHEVVFPDDAARGLV